jgi:Transposase domain (DUF772)
VPGCNEGDNYERGFPEIPVSSCRAAEERLDLAWVRAELALYYSSIGRPSIDPELMIRMLIIGYVFAIRDSHLIGVEREGSSCRASHQVARHFTRHLPKRPRSISVIASAGSFGGVICRSTRDCVSTRMRRTREDGRD